MEFRRADVRPVPGDQYDGCGRIPELRHALLVSNRVEHEAPPFFLEAYLSLRPFGGAESAFTKRRYHLGDTPECDVQLGLPKAASQHCVLRVSEQGVRLRMLRVRCRINGRRLKGEEADIPAHQRLDLGGGELSIARAGEDAPLPRIKSRRYGIRLFRLWGIALPGTMITGLMAVMLQAGRDLRASVPNHHRLFDLQGYQQALRMKFDQI